MKKKIIYSFGAITISLAPLVAAVSCGESEESAKESYYQKTLAKVGSALSKLYREQLILKLYDTNNLNETELVNEVQEKRWKMFQFYRDEMLRTDWKFFTNKIIEWNKEGYIKLGDKTEAGHPSKENPKVFVVPVIKKVLANPHLSPTFDWSALLDQTTFKALYSSVNIDFEMTINKLLIINAYFTKAREAWTIKNQNDDQKKEYYNLKDPYYFLIKFLVEQHPLFTWSATVSDVAYDEIPLQNASKWNKLFPKSGNMLRARQKVAKAHLIKTNKLAAVDMSAYFGYSGLQSALANVSRKNRFDFEIDTLKSYTSDASAIKQGFVKPDGTLNATGKPDPLNEKAFYGIQVLPKYVTSSKFFKLPNFTDPNDQATLVNWIILKNQNQFTNAINYYRDAGLFASSIYKVIQDQIDKLGIGKKDAK